MRGSDHNPRRLPSLQRPPYSAEFIDGFIRRNRTALETLVERAMVIRRAKGDRSPASRSPQWFEQFNPRGGVPRESLSGFRRAAATAAAIFDRALVLLDEPPSSAQESIGPSNEQARQPKIGGIGRVRRLRAWLVQTCAGNAVTGCVWRFRARVADSARPRMGQANGGRRGAAGRPRATSSTTARGRACRGSGKRARRRGRRVAPSRGAWAAPRPRACAGTSFSPACLGLTSPSAESAAGGCACSKSLFLLFA